MILNNLENNKVKISLFFKERLTNDPFVAQKIIKIDGVHRYEHKYYLISEIQNCIESANTLAELVKDIDKLEIVVEIYLDINDNDYYERMGKLTNNIRKSIKQRKIADKILKLVSKLSWS